MAFHTKITIKGIMQETKDIMMAIANLTIFLSCRSRRFWRQENRSLLFSFFFLIFHVVMLYTTARKQMGMGMKAMKVAVTNPLCVFLWSNAGPQFNKQYV